MLLRQINKRLGLSEAASKVLRDLCRKASCRHDGLSILRQRVYDFAIQTAVNRTDELASSSTLCRRENRSDRQAAWDFHEVMADQFVTSFDDVPKELILDFDATDDAVHDKQEGRSFNGYYDHYYFLPLYVFCKGQLLVSYLRPSNIDGAKHAWAILSLLVRRLRQAWPQVKIILRGDSGNRRQRYLSLNQTLKHAASTSTNMQQKVELK